MPPGVLRPAFPDTDPLPLDENGLYILLFDHWNGRHFDWELYLATSTESGTIFQVVYPGPYPHCQSYIFDARSSTNERRSAALIVAVKVAVMEPILHEALHIRLARIPIGHSTRFRGGSPRRVWVMEALYALDDEGYIKLTNSIACVELEALTAALINKNYERRSVIQSSYSLM
ncbi:hypothetical protein FQN54_001108 [Arachnomyces sp. PD_36]|nr:hypothetical protein FQN54_001108 [Arachnomyces sp. PD_36]